MIVSPASRHRQHLVYQDLAQFPRLSSAYWRSRPLAPQDAGLQRGDQRA
jgi:hypothetical protein